MIGPLAVGLDQALIYDRFDHVVLLPVPIETLLERVTTMTSNPYLSRSHERKEIALRRNPFEPLLRRSASIELEGRDEPASLVLVVEALVSA